MRLAFAISALFLCAAAPVVAEEAPPAVQAASTPSAEHLDAARSMSRLLLIDSDIVGVGIRAAFGVLEPQLRQQMLSGPFYENLRRDSQRALTVFVDGFPALIQAEMSVEMTVIAEDYAGRLTTVFSETEMLEIAAFLAQPAARSAYLKAVEAGARNTAAGAPSATGAPQLTPEEEAAFAVFGLTPSGQALDRNSERTTQMLNLALEAGTQRLMPRMQQRILRDMCAALSDECPAHVRAAIQ